MLERLNPCDNRNCLCEFMQAGFRPGEGYFEDIADLIALAAKILYSRVLNWIKHFRKKRGCQKWLLYNVKRPKSREIINWLKFYPKVGNS